MKGCLHMAQRSQVYIRIKSGNCKTLIAREFSWNFSGIMLSRTRTAIQNLIRLHIEKNFKNLKSDIDFFRNSIIEMLDIDFYSRKKVQSVDLMKDFELNGGICKNINQTIFYETDTTNGKLFIDVVYNEKDSSLSIKYALTDNEIGAVMNAEKYLKWDNSDNKNWTKGMTEEELNIIKADIEYLNNFSDILTKTDIDNIINDDYYKYIN